MPPKPSFIPPQPNLIPSPFRIPMATPPSNLDSLRSTRTRIAKPLNAATRASASASSQAPPVDPLERDFARFLGTRHPLRVIFMGHNPSQESWRLAAPYAHPSNRFWRLLSESGLVPEDLSRPQRFAELPEAVGVGFADLFVTSGSDASQVHGDKGTTLRREVLSRVLTGTGGVPPRVLCCVSKIVAKKLLAGWSGGYGRAGTGKDWGLDEIGDTVVWVLPSTSGRAGLTWEQRLSPFEELAKFANDDMPWSPKKEASKSLE